MSGKRRVWRHKHSKSLIALLLQYILTNAQISTISAVESHTSHDPSINRIDIGTTSTSNSLVHRTVASSSVSSTDTNSVIPTYTCPSTPNESITIVLPSSSTDTPANHIFDQPIQLKVSDIGQLCTLIRYYPGSEGTDSDKESQEEEAYFRPVARSYNGHDWEAAAGDYDTLFFECNRNDITESNAENESSPSSSVLGSYCKVTIPKHLPSEDAYTLDEDEDDNAIFQLTLLEYSITPREEMARFLEQATFGTTRQELNELEQSFNEVNTLTEKDNRDPDALKPTFTQWIQHQMDTSAVPMTSHRATWRRRTSPLRTQPDVEGAVSHPCDEGSRYTSDALVYHLDKGKDVVLTRVSKFMDELKERTVKSDTYNSNMYEHEEAMEYFEDDESYEDEREKNIEDLHMYLRSSNNATKSLKSSTPYFGWYSLSIDGQFRSMIKGANLKMEFANDHNRRKFYDTGRGQSPGIIVTSYGRVFLDEGQFQLCGSMFMGVYRMGVYAPLSDVGRRFDGDDEDDGGQICLFFANGNPSISFGYEPFTNILMDVWRSDPYLAPHIPPHVFDISSDSVTPIKQNEHWHADLRHRKAPDGIVLTQTDELDKDFCKNIPMANRLEVPPIVLIRLPDNQLMMHTPHLLWEKNTRYKPLADGGGGTVVSTGGSAYCSNAPPSFLNEQTCQISTEPMACASHTSAVGSLRLNAGTLQKLYKATGRLIYAISNLRVEDDDTTLGTPCTYGQPSRWKRVWTDATGLECNVNVHPMTQSLFSDLILENEDDNLHVRDVTSIPDGVSCHRSDDNKKQLVVQISDDENSCWKSIHPEQFNVYDMTSWSRKHPGNRASYNPIMEFAKRNETKLKYPDHHPMQRWNEIKEKLHYIGRFGDDVDFVDLPDIFKVRFVAETFGIFSPDMEEGKGVVVCGSPGEVPNKPSTKDALANAYAVHSSDTSIANDEALVFDGRTFDITQSASVDRTSFLEHKQQKKTVWTMVTLKAKDQLRQRMAWALNQLLVIDPTVGQPVNTEIYLHYYDIMVRNAFGNYKDILREVVYSPMMSETLTYYQSKSTDYVWERKKQHQYPDENFARELFQLFTIGLVEINADGTCRLDEEGKTIRTYSNADIMEYARAWTGFDRQNPRGNVEERSDFANSIDPMTIQINWRDHLPKLVQEKYIGDGYGLCSDLPPRHFLMKGAKFRIMSMKEVQNLDSLIPQNVEDMKVLELTSSSELAETLCQRKRDSSGVCSYPGTIELQRNLRCWGDECMVSNARIVRLGDIYYEHIRPPCVYLSFFNNGKFVSKRHSLSGRKEERMCVDPDTANFEGDFWDSSSDCEVFIIVDKKGRVAIERNEIYKQYFSHTFFRVLWNGKFPSAKQNECGLGSCERIGKYCRCSISVKTVRAYNSMPSREEVLSDLHIGGNPEAINYDSEETLEDVHAYLKNGSFGQRTVFKTIDDRGQTVYRKNTKSKVLVVNTDGSISSFSFRNPPRFYSSIPEKIMAVHETEAALDHAFYHKNTPAFLAQRFLQRFGVSNPSPQYILSVAEAFKKGLFAGFGDGEYGNLAATVASILLHRESRHTILDADATHGSIKEPLIKVVSTMRSLEYEQTANEFPSLFGMEVSIGQMAYEIPSVFSFFLPEYAPPGRVSKSSLVAPEAMLLYNNVNLLNGMFSLVKFGLTPCHEGFGHRIKCYWENTLQEGTYDNSAGYLSLSMDNLDNPDAVIDELSTIMTSGRMSIENREIIKEAYIKLAGDDKSKAFRMAQQLTLSSPEFHTTGLSKKSRKIVRNQRTSATKTCKRYKAVVHILLAGGADSFNMLVPHSQCEASGKDLYQEYKNERGTVALKKEALLKINADNQPCSVFGVHPSLSQLQSMYNRNDALFLANIGVLQQPVSANNYAKVTKTQLFAHNAMQAEITRVGGFKSTRMLGRLSDTLTKRGYKVDSFAIDTSLQALEGMYQNTTKAAINSRNGFKRFDPSGSNEILSLVQMLNSQTSLQSNIHSETWSSSLHKSLDMTNELYWAQRNANISEAFPSGSNDIGRQLELVSKMISSAGCRGSDRDIFYVEVPQYDHHSKMMSSLKTKFDEMNDAITAFESEMKTQGRWDDVTVVVTSDFGRTLTPNSNDGTDHAWGGNAFLLGGEVNGGKIVGEYPDDLTSSGPLNIGRGRLLPTLPWDSLWNSVAEWIGSTDDDLNYVLPNRLSFLPDQLFSKSTLFETNSRLNKYVGCKDEGKPVSCIGHVQSETISTSTNVEDGGNPKDQNEHTASSSTRSNSMGAGAIVGVVLSCSIVVISLALGLYYRDHLYLWFHHDTSKPEKHHRRVETIDSWTVSVDSSRIEVQFL